MDWRQTLLNLGLIVPEAADLVAALITAVTIAAILVLGWLIQHRLLPRLYAELPWRLERPDSRAGLIIATLVRFTFILLAMLILRQLLPQEPFARALLAAALAVTAGMAAWRLVRASDFGGTMLAGVLSFIVLAIVAVSAFGGSDRLVAALDGVGFNAGSYRISLLGGISVLAVGVALYLAARLAISLAKNAIGGIEGLDPSQELLAQKLAGLVITVVAVLVGIDALGIDLTALALFSGALGLAVGFGLQKTLGNLIAGLILLMDRSIKPGDVIVVGDTFGWVDKIGVRAVSVVTRDGKEHLIPNEQLMTEPVENWSHSSQNVRVHIPVGVSYRADMAVAQRLMIEAAAASPRVLADPAPAVWMTEFGDSSVNFDILVWIIDPELGVGNVRSDVLNRLWDLFKAHDVEIPFPQLDLHIRSNAAGLGRPPEA
jgi:small-conductance mechanosensitive channel